MSIKVITKDAMGKPKKCFFTDVIEGGLVNASDNNHSRNDVPTSDQAREQMIKRNRDAWKK